MCAIEPQGHQLQAALERQVQQQERELQQARGSTTQLAAAAGAEVSHWADRAGNNWQLACAVAAECDAASRQVRSEFVPYDKPR